MVKITVGSITLSKHNLRSYITISTFYAFSLKHTKLFESYALEISEYDEELLK